MEHFGAVFKLDLTEKETVSKNSKHITRHCYSSVLLFSTRTQLQEDEAIAPLASYWRRYYDCYSSNTTVRLLLSFEAFVVVIWLLGPIACC